jgi:hypothetical protein
LSELTDTDLSPKSFPFFTFKVKYWDVLMAVWQHCVVFLLFQRSELSLIFRTAMSRERLLSVHRGRLWGMTSWAAEPGLGCINSEQELAGQCLVLTRIWEVLQGWTGWTWNCEKCLIGPYRDLKSCMEGQAWTWNCEKYLIKVHNLCSGNFWTLK